MPGFNLKAKWVIHAVGPIYRDGEQGEPDLLASAYRTSLQLASENGAKTVAVPAISTGVYGYPMTKAADVSLQTVIDYLKENDGIEQVRFVLFGPEAYQTFEAVLATKK